MKSSVYICIQIFFLCLVLSCSKKVEPETTLNRDGTNSDNSSEQNLGFNDGADELVGLGDPLRGSFNESDPLAPRDPALSAFEDPLNVIRPFDPVFFGFDQYNLNSTERNKIVEIAEFMKENTQARLLVEGYCDWKGTPDYNKSLGDRRATTVKDYLVDIGCDAGRIEVISIGDELAIPNADTEQARLDRRATFVVSKGN
mgnify:CR=1 FL=1